jgi:UrcA family protein
MKKIITIFLATALSSIVGSAAYAQASQPAETVIVVAPYLMTEKAVSANPHVRLLDVSISGTANYGDLDLGKADDVAKLKARVRSTAETLCKQLAQKYPGYVAVTNQDCPKAATDEAMDIVNSLASAYAHP